MPNEVRTYNDMKTKMLEAAAFEELKRDFIQSAQDEIQKVIRHIDNRAVRCGEI